MSAPQYKPCDLVRWHPAYTQKAIDLRIIRLLEIDEETGEPWYRVYDSVLGNAFVLPEHVLRPLPRPARAEWNRGLNADELEAYSTYAQRWSAGLDEEWPEPAGEVPAW